MATKSNHCFAIAKAEMLENIEFLENKLIRREEFNKSISSTTIPTKLRIKVDPKTWNEMKSKQTIVKFGRTYQMVDMEQIPCGSKITPFQNTHYYQVFFIYELIK